ncbi:MAG: hypothetical protein ACOWWM_20945 [Desulfobacterales bacterium]
MEIIWENPEGRPQGVYMKAYIPDEAGNRIELRPAYFGTLGEKTGLVAHRGYQRYILEIPEADYTAFKDRCMRIFREG